MERISVTKKFIDCYKSHPALWDINSTEHSCPFRKKAAYEELTKILRDADENATVQDAKRKLNTLRTNYGREINKIRKAEENNSAINGVYRPSVWWFSRMDFLKEYYNKKKPKPGYIELQEEWSDLNQEVINVEIERISSPTQPIAAPSAKVPQIEEDPFQCADETDLLETLDRYFKESEDEFVALGKMWTFQYKDLSEDQKIYAKEAIDAVLDEAELGKLCRHSIRIRRK